MTRTSFILAGALSAAGLLLCACGGGGTSNGTGGAGGTGASTGGSGPALTCDDYCAEVMANCTAANQQYADADHCKAVCGSFPPGQLADTSGDTLGCRIYHGGAAKADPVTHCSHAGPSGGDLDPSDTAAGPCGEACEAFCNLAQVACTGANAQYADTAACMADCKTFKPSTAAFGISDASSDSYNCRLYHLTAATLDPAVHCPHIPAASPVCTM